MLEGCLQQRCVAFAVVTVVALLSPHASLLADEPAPAADRKPRPCTGERHRDFDFWLGEWDVYDPQGKKVGTNSIRQQIAGCMLFESWTGAGGNSVGQSMNFVDPETSNWKQIWVDGSGGWITIEGGLSNGAMLLEGEHVYGNGDKKSFRGTWTPLEDGRVRQHFEESDDGGKTWRTWFDGYYVRRDAGS